MSDWQAGDRAICVDAGPPKQLEGRRECEPRWVKGLRVGAMYHVASVHPAAVGDLIGLKMMEGVAGVSQRFRKLVEHRSDEFDRETIAMLNSAPKREMA